MLKLALFMPSYVTKEDPRKIKSPSFKLDEEIFHHEIVSSFLLLFNHEAVLKTTQFSDFSSLKSKHVSPSS